MLCLMGINQKVVIALEGGCKSNPCTGQCKVAKGKVANPANQDMYVKDNVHNMQTKAMLATVHAMNKVKRTSGHAFAQW